MGVISIAVSSGEAAIRLRTEPGVTLAETETISWLEAYRRRDLARTVWVWCWTHGMDENGPCAAFAVSENGKVSSHAVDARMLMPYYGARRVEA